MWACTLYTDAAVWTRRGTEHVTTLVPRQINFLHLFRGQKKGAFMVFNVWTRTRAAVTKWGWVHDFFLIILRLKSILRKKSISRWKVNFAGKKSILGKKSIRGKKIISRWKVNSEGKKSILRKKIQFWGKKTSIFWGKKVSSGRKCQF